MKNTRKMRKSIKAITAAVLLTAVLITVVALAGCSSQSNIPTEYKNETTVATAAPATAAPTTAAPETTAAAQQQENTGITIDDAVSIALKDAGFVASEVQITKKAQDTDDGIQKYEIDFINSGYEYEYDINAQTGAIIEKSKDFEND